MLALVEGEKYIYFINTSLNIDFNNINDNAFEYIKNQFDVDGFAELKFNNLDEFKDLFYQTDHHWNYKGSYQGYKEIMSLLEGEEFEVLVPTGIKTYNAIFNGGNARDCAIKWSTEPFTVYEYDLPPYKTYINGKEMTYGSRDLYAAKKVAGIEIEDITTMDDFQKLPFSEKADLRDAYPLGLMAVSEEEIVRIHSSSGTTGTPVIIPYTAKDVDDWAIMFARCYEIAGLTKEDRVQITPGYGLWTAGIGFQAGVEKLATAKQVWA